MLLLLPPEVVRNASVYTSSVGFLAKYNVSVNVQPLPFSTIASEPTGRRLVGRGPFTTVRWRPNLASVATLIPLFLQSWERRNHSNPSNYANCISIAYPMYKQTWYKISTVCLKMPWTLSNDVMDFVKWCHGTKSCHGSFPEWCHGSKSRHNLHNSCICNGYTLYIHCITLSEMWGFDRVPVGIDAHQSFTHLKWFSIATIIKF